MGADEVTSNIVLEGDNEGAEEEGDTGEKEEVVNANEWEESEPKLAGSTVRIVQNWHYFRIKSDLNRAETLRV